MNEPSSVAANPVGSEDGGNSVSIEAGNGDSGSLGLETGLYQTPEPQDSLESASQASKSTDKSTRRRRLQNTHRNLTATTATYHPSLLSNTIIANSPHSTTHHLVHAAGGSLGHSHLRRLAERQSSSPYSLFLSSSSSGSSRYQPLPPNNGSAATESFYSQTPSLTEIPVPQPSRGMPQQSNTHTLLGTRPNVLSEDGNLNPILMRLIQDAQANLMYRQQANRNVVGGLNTDSDAGVRADNSDSIS
ncbi:hypothetical protein BCR33DRAFT_713810, partial [Rhizoclosmatium globosum]